MVKIRNSHISRVTSECLLLIDDLKTNAKDDKATVNAWYIINKLEKICKIASEEDIKWLEEELEQAKLDQETNRRREAYYREKYERYVDVDNTEAQMTMNKLKKDGFSDTQLQILSELVFDFDFDYEEINIFFTPDMKPDIIHEISKRLADNQRKTNKTLSPIDLAVDYAIKEKDKILSI